MPELGMQTHWLAEKVSPRRTLGRAGEVCHHRGAEQQETRDGQRQVEAVGEGRVGRLDHLVDDQFNGRTGVSTEGSFLLADGPSGDGSNNLGSIGRWYAHGRQSLSQINPPAF